MMHCELMPLRSIQRLLFGLAFLMKSAMACILSITTTWHVVELDHLKAKKMISSQAFPKRAFAQ